MNGWGDIKSLPIRTGVFPSSTLSVDVFPLWMNTTMVLKDILYIQYYIDKPCLAIPRCSKKGQTAIIDGKQKKNKKICPSSEVGESSTAKT